jgi:putative glutamine amidotransferase
VIFVGFKSTCRPLIGITPGFNYDDERVSISKNCMDSINEAGGLAVLMSLTDNEEVLMDFIKRCDGFLISGGPDVDAKYYDEENLSFTGSISPLRDVMDIFIAKKAFEAKKPILGICRGNQVLNVAMGGTLYQDIDSQIKEKKILKHAQKAPIWHPTHEISIEKNSAIWKMFGKEIARINTSHHQAVRDIAPGFIATSKSSDGVIESIEYVGQCSKECEGNKKQFAVGIQWHPEALWKKDIIHLNIFKQFILAASLC